jgi:hypothetical protein
MTSHEGGVASPGNRPHPCAPAMQCRKRHLADFPACQATRLGFLVVTFVQRDLRKAPNPRGSHRGPPFFGVVFAQCLNGVADKSQADLMARF